MSLRSIENAIRIGLASSVIGAGCGYLENDSSANELPIPTPVTQPVDQAPTVIPSSEANGFRELPLTVRLSSEVMEKIIPNIVEIERVTKDGFANHVPNTHQCNGFIVEDYTNTQFAVTAKHCIPGVFLSDEDDKTYLTESADGSIFYANLIKSDGESIPAGDDFHRLSNSDETNSEDVTMARLPKNIGLPGLPINIDELDHGEVYFVVSTSEGLIYFNSVHFLNNEKEYGNFFLNLSDRDACTPGTSGSAIVNSAGEVVSMIYATSSHTITKGEALALNINPIHIGRVVDACFGVPAPKIYELMGNSN